MMDNVSDEKSSEIAFFDLEIIVVDEETMRPGRGRRSSPIIEIGAIVVSQRTLVEVLRPFSTLVRPNDPSLISCLGAGRSNGITQDAVNCAPTFEQIADDVYFILHGRIWAGHNIKQFDCPLLEEAFWEIGRQPPKPKGIIDSLQLLTQTFGTRAGNMKLESLAAYFHLGTQTHRSLDDVRMNLEVIKHCATVLFLESNPPESEKFLEPDEVSIQSISACLEGHKLKLLHGGTALQLCCRRLRVRYGILLNPTFVDAAGWPKLSFVVDASPSLCRILDACDDAANTLTMDLGSTSSEWKDVVTTIYGEPTLRLIIPTIDNGNGTAQHETEIHVEDPNSGRTEELVFDHFDPERIGALLNPGTRVDAYLSLDHYDYRARNCAGIRLLAKRLIIRN